MPLCFPNSWMEDPPKYNIKKITATTKKLTKITVICLLGKEIDFWISSELTSECVPASMDILKLYISYENRDWFTII